MSFFTFTNSVDPDEMQHYAAFHLGIHCLQKYYVCSFPKYKGLINYPPGHEILVFTVNASSKGSDEPDNQAFTHKEEMYINAQDKCRGLSKPLLFVYITTIENS